MLMNENTTITMKDIARELGVSVATVSRALKDSPRISEVQRQRIKTYAREHNFFPNVIAESLRLRGDPAKNHRRHHSTNSPLLFFHYSFRR